MELKLQSNSSLELFLPCQQGREGKKKSLSLCQQTFNVSNSHFQPLPFAEANEGDVISLESSPSDHKPFPKNVPQTEM